MKRRNLLLVGLLLTLAIPFAVLRVLTPRPAPCPVDVRPETWEKLQLGMCENEIEAVLGAPACDYRTNKDIGYVFSATGALFRLPAECIRREWLVDERAIEIWFDTDGKAVYIHSGTGIRPPTWYEQVIIYIKDLF